ncbi:MAG: YncE family protein [Alphaproteobacteria bacterium]|nr:YncE family protein [Alphaproteobacteria bacterium]
MRTTRMAGALAALMMGAMAGAGAAQAAPAPTPGQAAYVAGLHVIRRFPGPDGGWDYASFDPAHRRLFVAHGDRVLALDVDSGKLNTDFAAGSHLHEILPIPHENLIVTTNSGDKTVRILTADGKLKATLPVAPDADGAVYDPATGLAVVINGDAGLLTLVDPRAAKVVGTIPIVAGLEFGAVDGHGRAYINIESQDQIAVVDLRARKVVTRYALQGCHGPGGLALVSGDRLITACHNGDAEVLDARTGHEIASLKIGGFPDAVIYDPIRNLAYIPTAMDGKLNVVALSGPHDNQVIGRVPTQIGARTGAVDPKTGHIYLPAATYNLPVPKGQRPTTKPGTFVILEVGRS